MKICFISDTHGFHDQVIVPECDVLVHCGDFCSSGSKVESIKFLDWFCRRPAKFKLFIAGNHDICWEQDPAWVGRTLLTLQEEKVVYLLDSGTEIEGVNFWGSPWQPEFCNWAFNLPRGGDKLYQAWQKIPRNTDVLIIHSPLKGILDRCERAHSNPNYPQEAGCELLRHRVEEVGSIKICAFGHIHEGYGMNPYTLNPTICINTSTCNSSYQPVNKPIVIDL